MVYGDSMLVFSALRTHKYMRVDKCGHRIVWLMLELFLIYLYRTLYGLFKCFMCSPLYICIVSMRLNILLLYDC